MRSEKTKLDSLRALCQTIVRNVKKDKASSKEDKLLKQVASDLLGREATSDDLSALVFD